MKISDMPLQERPREKLIAKGPSHLQMEDLIAILFRTGKKGRSVVEIARDLMLQFPLPKLASIQYIDLIAIDGISGGKACSLLAALELGKRVYSPGLPVQSTSLSIDKPVDALAHIIDIMSQKKEHCIVLYLNARQQVMHKELISIGTLDRSLLHPREVFEPAITHLASAVVLAHNHPSGDIQPSAADIDITYRLVRAGKLLGIDVMDHIIVSRNSYYSFRESGRLQRQSTKL